MFRHNALRYMALVLLASGALFQAFASVSFGLEILTEILILAMLVLALDIVAGFGGMVSLCHGALMGVGAYAYAILSAKGGLAPPVAMAGAIALTGSTAWIIGAICSRSHGIYFIIMKVMFMMTTFMMTRMDSSQITFLMNVISVSSWHLITLSLLIKVNLKHI